MVTAGNSINYHVAKTSQKTNNAASKTPEVASAKSRQSMDMRTLAYDRGQNTPMHASSAVSKEILSVASPEDTFFPWHVEMQLQRVCAMCTSEAQVVRRTRDLLHEWLSAPSKSRDNGLLLTGHNTHWQKDELGHNHGNVQDTFVCPRHRTCPGFPFSACRWWMSCNVCTPLKVVFRESSNQDFCDALTKGRPHLVGEKRAGVFSDELHARLVAVAMKLSKEGKQQRATPQSPRPREADDEDTLSKKKKERDDNNGLSHEDFGIKTSTDGLVGNSFFLFRFLATCPAGGLDFVKACDWNDPIQKLKEITLISRTSVEALMPCFAATFKEVEAEEFEALVFIARFFQVEVGSTPSVRELYAALLNHENRVEEKLENILKICSLQLPLKKIRLPGAACRDEGRPSVKKMTGSPSLSSISQPYGVQISAMELRTREGANWLVSAD